MIAVGLAALVAAVTHGLRGFEGFAAGLASSLVVMNVFCFFFCFFVPLAVSSVSSVTIGLSGKRATPFALSVGGAVSGDFFLFYRRQKGLFW